MQIQHICIYYSRIIEPFSDSNGSLCHGDAIVGNIIDKVRRERRRHLSKMNASESRPSTSSSRTISSGNSANTSSGHQFPNVLPQCIVELELGIVEIQNPPSPSVLEIRSVSANDTNSSELLLHRGDEATAKLLAAARKWRETSQRSRSTGVHGTKWYFFLSADFSSLFYFHPSVTEQLNKTKIYEIGVIVMELNGVCHTNNNNTPCTKQIANSDFFISMKEKNQIKNNYIVFALT